MRKRTANPNRPRNRRIRTAMPSPEEVKGTRLPRHTRVNGRVIEIAQNLAGGKSQVRLETGSPTYRAIPFSIVSDAEIVGETTEVAGRHIVDTAFISKYVDNVALLANGAPMQDLTTDELIMRNNFHDQDFGEGVTGFHFPGENMYLSPAVRDTFALGTRGMRGLKLELSQTAAFNATTMQVKCMPNYVLMPRKTGFVNTTERVIQSFGAVGKHTFTDLPDSDDLQNFWLIGAGITDLKVEVDGEVLIDCNRHEYNAYLLSEGRFPAAVGDNWFIDLHSSGEARSLAALDLPAETRRGAKVKIDLTTTVADTEVQFLATHAGLYQNIR
ncbi:MAG: hypothetical protein KUG74_01100 [Rhodobacteraceae bacterium]|nr:hypothetical protein [Paracoccaceae bacterium]